MKFDKDSYYQETFTSLSLTNETVKAVEFEECEFKGCSFVGSTFQKCKFISCKLEGCVWSAVNPMNSWFAEVKFFKCKVIGCDWTRASHLQEMEFTDCQLNYSNFAMLKLPKTRMINCQAMEADFTETDLNEGVFTGTDFSRSTFFRTNLSKADLKKAVNYAIDPRNNTLKGTHFSLPEALSLLQFTGYLMQHRL